MPAARSHALTSSQHLEKRHRIRLRTRCHMYCKRWQLSRQHKGDQTSLFYFLYHFAHAHQETAAASILGDDFELTLGQL